MTEEKINYLSASKIKTLQSCSWLYWCKYHLKLPEEGNDGSSRGTICHLIFECLGNPRHKKHYTKILKKKSVWSVPSIKKLIIYHAKKLKIFDKENMELVNEMIINGLSYDFFGNTDGRPTKSVSEQEFNIEKNDGEKKYNIRGFIDKLFLYKSKSQAIIRDFKTSKKVFEGKDLTDNLQDLMYSLAVKKLYPEFMQRSSEFLFLKFSLAKDLLGEEGEGVVKMDSLSDDELEGFEFFLTEVQSLVDSFDEESATSNLAADQDFPKDGSFSGPLCCGFAKQPNQLKKDGTKMWHCPHKFSYYYWVAEDEEGNQKMTFLTEPDPEKIPTELSLKKSYYKGCPKWNADDF